MNVPLTADTALSAKDRPELARHVWDDPFLLESQLSDDERMIRDSAAAYAAEISAFVQSVSEETQTPTTGYDGLMALALAEAALISVNERRVVDMKEVLESGS